MTDTFDPANFMNQGTNEAGSTSFEPIPSGEYTAMIDEVNPRQVTGKDGGARIVLDLTWLLMAPEVAAKLGREKLTVRQGIFLDMTPGGALDMSKGKNIGLNKVRDALGFNKPGQSFTFNMLKGAGPAKITTSLRPVGDVIYTDVKSVGKM
jgi:hypothetical protein